MQTSMKELMSIDVFSYPMMLIMGGTQWAQIWYMVPIGLGMKRHPRKMYSLWE